MSQPLRSFPHFDLKTLARTLKLSSIDVIKTSSTEIESHWYRSSGDADLYYWLSKGKLVKHQITLFNQVVEWNEFDGVKTGFINDEHGGGELVMFDKDVNKVVLVQVTEFLSHASSIEDTILSKINTHHKFVGQWDRWPALKAIKRLFKR